jgi:hypothetical protein
MASPLDIDAQYSIAFAKGVLLGGFAVNMFGRAQAMILWNCVTSGAGRFWRVA